MATLAELAADRRVGSSCPSLAEAAARAANPRIRAVATLGGHLAHADPRQDLPPVLLALGAVVTVSGPHGVRQIPVGELLTGFMATALQPDELVVEVGIPPRAGRRDRYVRFAPNSALDFPTVGVAAEVVLDESGVVTAARVALGGVAPTAVLVAGAPAALVGRRPSAGDLDRLAEAAAEAAAPTDDQRGSVEYKTAMAAVWARRAVAGLVTPRRGG
jgi:carbon-monoxide dehydrogenase medium subunit